MKVKADLHNHLRTVSRLRQGDFNRAVDLASQRLGENGIFAMVNFNDRRYEDLIGLKGYERDYIGADRNAVYVPEKKVLIVKGQEVPTQQGHLLVLGLDYEVHMKPDKPLNYSLEEAVDRNAIAVADHPYNSWGVGNYLENNIGLYSDLSAIEIHNGETLGKANQEAKHFYHELKFLYPAMNIGALSSSDGHSFYELGANWTEIKMPDIVSQQKFIPSLKKSIDATNLQTLRKERISYRGIAEHSFVIGLAIFFPKFFETDRPNF